MSELGSTLLVLGRKVKGDDYRAVLKLTTGRALSVTLASRQAGDTVPLSNKVSLIGRYQAGEEIKIRMPGLRRQPDGGPGQGVAGHRTEPTAWAVTGRTGLIGCSVVAWLALRHHGPRRCPRSAPPLGTGLGHASGDRLADASVTAAFLRTGSQMFAIRRRSADTCGFVRRNGSA